MTAREIYEAVLIELNKEQAPNLLLEDFNYFFNRAIYQYINKRYNIYDVNQQTTDDLRVLKATAILQPIKTSYKDKKWNGNDKLQSLLQDDGETGIEFNFMNATYTVTLPDDYLHILNCECFYKVKAPYKCYDKGTVTRAAAKRLTADAWTEVVDNFYMRPMYYRPYYYIHNVNTNIEVPTNPAPLDMETIENTGTDKGNLIWNDSRILLYKVSDLNDIENVGDLYDMIGLSGDSPEVGGQGPWFRGKWESNYNSYVLQYYDEEEDDWIYSTSTEYKGFKFKPNPQAPYLYYSIKPINPYGSSNNTKTTEEYKDTELGLDPFREIDINGYVTDSDVTYPQRNSQVRYGNASKVLMEIRYGEDTSVFELRAVAIDYIKTPQHIRLTQEQIDKTLDTSQTMEYPDYVCLEIINELVHIIMENASDLRLQTHPVVSLSIANPVQQLAAQPAELA